MIKVTYDDHMGSDVMVVNRARVSFRKRTSVMRPRDERLIGFLARKTHWAPFSHPQISMHVAAPVFVVRQCFKHKVGFAESEVSRRYVDDEPTMFHPVWRRRAEDKKQGSLDEFPPALDEIDALYLYQTQMSLQVYRKMIELEVAPEQARAVLPQSMMTEWFWTGSLAAWSRFFNQRTGEDAQRETAEVAIQAGAIIGPLFPVSWKALTG